MNRRVFEPTPLRPNPELDFVRLARIIRNGWLVIAAAAFLGALVAAFVVLREIPTYTATAQIMLGQKNRADDTLGNLFQEFSLDNADIAGEIAIIQSGRILTDVSERLELGNNPQFNPALREPETPSLISRITESVKNGIKAALSGGTAASDPGTASRDDANPVVQAAAAGRAQFGAEADYVGTLGAGLKVSQVGNTYLLNISYASSDRQLAAAVPNTVVDVYLEEQLNRKFRAIQRVTAGLDTRLTALRQRLEAAERAVVDYRNQILAEGLGTRERLDQQLRELSSRLGAASAEQASLASELTEIDTLMDSGGALAAAGLFSSDLLNTLRNEIATAEQRRALWNERFGENSPQVQEADEEIARLEKTIETEIARLRTDKINLESVARARVEALQQQLRALEQQELELSKRAITMAQLEREMEANRVTYESFLGKFTETSEVVDLQEADAQVISYAQPPSSPATPRKKLAVALGLFAGAMLGLGVVLIRSQGNSVVASLAQLRDTLGSTHVLSLPRLGGLLRAPDPPGFILQEPQSPLSEAVRGLRSFLLLSNSGSGSGKSVAIVSCGANAGKTTTSLMLGRSIAQMGKSCVLVETDLRRGGIGKMVQIPPRPDLIDVLSGTATLEEALHADPDSGLSILNARTSLRDPAAVLMSTQMEALIQALEDTFDVIIFDTAPLLSVSDAVPLMKHADHVVLLAREGKTTVKELENGLRLVKDAAAKLACVALTFARKDKTDGYEYY